MATLDIGLFWIVTPVLPMTLPLWALTVVVPKDTPVSRPVLLMVAMLVAVVLHVTLLVTSPVLLLPKVAVAVYCWVTPGATIAFDGRTCSAVMEVDDGKNCPQPMKASRQASTRAGQKTR